MDLLKQNVMENETSENRIQIEILTWGQDVSKFQGPYDIVIAADCIYDTRYVQDLLQSMYKLCDLNSNVIMAFDRHDVEAIEEFWEQVGDYFQVERVAKEDLDQLYQDQHIEVLNMKKLLKL